MFKILLVCSGGITSSLLAKRISEKAKELNLKYIVKSTNITAGLRECSKYDIVLISPQIDFTYDLFLKKVKTTNIHIVKVNKEDFFSYNADHVIEMININLQKRVINSLNVTFVYKNEKSRFIQFYQNFYNYLEKKKINNIKISILPYKEIFNKTFNSDFIVMDFEFFNGGNPMKGLITNKKIPYIILHIYYYSGNFYREVVDIILKEHKKVRENITMDEIINLE